MDESYNLMHDLSKKKLKKKNKTTTWCMKFDILTSYKEWVHTCVFHAWLLTKSGLKKNIKKWSWKLNKLQEKYQQNNRPISYFEKENGKTRYVNMGIIKYSQVTRLPYFLFYFIANGVNLLHKKK
jgi:hypothetical protein